jgi:hypothetical protein
VGHEPFACVPHGGFVLEQVSDLVGVVGLGGLQETRGQETGVELVVPFGPPAEGVGRPQVGFQFGVDEAVGRVDLQKEVVWFRAVPKGVESSYKGAFHASLVWGGVLCAANDGGQKVVQDAWDQAGILFKVQGYPEVAGGVVRDLDAIGPFSLLHTPAKHVGRDLVRGVVGAALVLDVLFLGCLSCIVTPNGSAITYFHMGNQEIDRLIDLSDFGLTLFSLGHFVGGMCLDLVPGRLC